MATPVVFKYGTRAQYDAATKVDNALYFLTDTGEIYRGSVNLARGSHYEGIRIAADADDNATIARVLAEANAIPVQDDIFVVKKVIHDNNYAYTSYVYNKGAWNAMDGNYDASNIYFSEDITVTSSVGNVVPDASGSAKIPAAGKNLKQVFESLWTKEDTNPSVESPDISVTLSNTSVEGEVGTTFTAPTVTASISKFGKFEFGSKDANGQSFAADANSDVEFSKLTVGAAATAAALDESNSASIEGITAASAVQSVSYTGVAGTFADGAQTQKFSASASHGASARKAVSNLGNFVNALGTAAVADFESAGKGIAANDLVKNAAKTFTATGYRAWFIGGYNARLTKDQITSAFIRDNLVNKGKIATSTITLEPGKDGNQCVLIAIPQGKGSLTKATLTSTMNTDILPDYTKNKFSVSVADASGAEGTETTYDVYWYQNAVLGSDEVHELVITKA